MGYQLGMAAQETIQAKLIAQVTQDALTAQQEADEATARITEAYYETIGANDVRMALLLAEIDRTAITVCDNPYLPDIVGQWLQQTYCDSTLHKTRDPTCLDERAKAITLNEAVSYSIFIMKEYDSCGEQVNSLVRSIDQSY